jgi:hypothetical protein
MGNIPVEFSLLGFAFVPVHCFTSGLRPNLVLNQNYFVDSEMSFKICLQSRDHALFFPSLLFPSRIEAHTTQCKL